MAVAPRPWQTPQLPVQSRRSQRQATKPSPAFVPTAPKPVTLKKTATNSPKSSTKLKVFAMGQRFTQFLAIASVGTAVAIYAYTVYNQKAWGEEYAKLSRLQSNERSFVSTNESIKEQLIESAGKPAAKLVDPTPKSNLFIPEPKAVQLRPEEQPTLKPIQNQAPIGY